jgi:hypothetical protein
MPSLDCVWVLRRHTAPPSTKTMVTAKDRHQTRVGPPRGPARHTVLAPSQEHKTSITFSHRGDNRINDRCRSVSRPGGGHLQPTTCGTERPKNPGLIHPGMDKVPSLAREATGTRVGWAV